MAGPLSGIRIIDMTTWIFGPLATQILGDLGADVIKIEAPDGDVLRRIGPGRNANMSGMFLNINRNKRSVTLDLKNPDDHQKLMKLVATADVFVHNMRMKPAERLRIDSAAIRAANPTIVYAVGTGFKKDGPWKDRAAFDDIIQGASGIASLSLKATGEARYAPMALADKMTAQALSTAILAAVVAKLKTGVGDDVYVPMLETMLCFNLVENLWTAVFDGQEGAVGYPRVVAASRKPYRTSDGHICAMPSTDIHWSRLFVAFGASELLEDPRFKSLADRSANIDALYRTLSGLLAQRSTQECQTLLDEADIPNSPMLDLDRVRENAYLAETGFFESMEHETEGSIVMPAIPFEFERDTVSIERLAPNLGQHNDEVFRDLETGSSAEAAE